MVYVTNLNIRLIQLIRKSYIISLHTKKIIIFIKYLNFIDMFLEKQLSSCLNIQTLISILLILKNRNTNFSNQSIFLVL